MKHINSYITLVCSSIHIAEGVHLVVQETNDIYVFARLSVRPPAALPARSPANIGLLLPACQLARVRCMGLVGLVCCVLHLHLVCLHWFAFGLFALV